METVLSGKSDSVVVDDARHITDVLINLDDRCDALTVSLHDQTPHAPFDYPVHLDRLDPAAGELSLVVTDAGSLDAPTLGDQRLTLRAENDQTLRFESIRVLEAERYGDALQLRCAFPRRLLAAARRQSARITLRKDMPVSAAITRYVDQPPMAATLRDISSGGCLLSLPLAECAALSETQALPEVTLTFPSGERFSIDASVRHITPVPRSDQAAVGLAFDRIDRPHQRQLAHLVSSTEREIAWRSGEGSRLAAPTPLYTSADRPRRKAAKRRPTRTASGLKTLRDIARHQHLFLLALQNGRPLPVERLERSANQLIKLLGKGRQTFFYDLACLSDEPQWMQHSLNVAGRLADLMLAEPALAADTHRAVRAALVHDLGKAMLIDEALPSLESEMSDAQRTRLRGHVGELLTALERANYPIDALEREIISDINERLDGSGYPRGVTGEALSPVARLAAVIDVIDAMTRARGDRPALNAVKAYRYLYNRPARFDRHWVTRYVQRHGFYPLGSLVRFSHGYLAWVVALDERGQPCRVRVVRNTRREGIFYDDEIGRVDFDQLGRLVESVQPEHYGL
ncbi:HD-GYP domain-containing protein (c-di-GMP phosphodiesterase class II) [Vreelandella songnenensis]|uniref:HD-GYP domain-containing protein (C-di-GMP phosphodiesterase class II) n=1 Tax=Vreelandella songnenensis TaxID=1176243 RepID=A0A2T0V2R5_9GAMM|nr:HD domain-containing phosphohydrolase [Halomonas songnenensis]PRY64476.1 HD-GYP domain-containing protein (c-di-GMP phosphodiesterase class II) [Halomonas songnenensis]